MANEAGGKSVSRSGNADAPPWGRCSGDRSVPCVIRQLIRSPDYLWVYDSSSMFYMMIVYCCVCVTVVVTNDVGYCVSDGDCCCVVVLCAEVLHYY